MPWVNLFVETRVDLETRKDLPDGLVELVELRLVGDQPKQDVPQIQIGVALRDAGRHDGVRAPLLKERHACEPRHENRQRPSPVGSTIVERVVVIERHADVSVLPALHR